MEQLPCKSTFDMTVHVVIEAVKERLKHGEISRHDLEEIENALTVGNRQVNAFCHSVYDKCMDKHKLDALAPPRTNAYGRIMVQPLESLFDTKQPRMSPAQLSHYFLVLEQILGRAVYETYHDEMATLMRAEMRDRGSYFTWDRFYSHPDVTYVRRHTLAIFAQTFEHFEKRLSWFLSVMEGRHTEGVQTYPSTMTFTHHQAKMFFMALFNEFIEMNPKEKDEMKKQLGERERRAINLFLSHVVQMS